MCLHVALCVLLAHYLLNMYRTAENGSTLSVNQQRSAGEASGLMKMFVCSIIVRSNQDSLSVCGFVVFVYQDLLTGGPAGPGGPLLSWVQVQALGMAGQSASFLWMIHGMMRVTWRQTFNRK